LWLKAPLVTTLTKQQASSGTVKQLTVDTFVMRTLAWRASIALTRAIAEPYNEAKKNGWSVISKKNDWNRIFTF
jgi:hypothetical protein